jgi:hypothetical protein
VVNGRETLKEKGFQELPYPGREGGYRKTR